MWSNNTFYQRLLSSPLHLFNRFVVVVVVFLVCLLFLFFFGSALVICPFDIMDYSNMAQLVVLFFTGVGYPGRSVHDDVIKWEIFHWSPVNSPHKKQ